MYRIVFSGPDFTEDCTFNRRDRAHEFATEMRKDALITDLSVYWEEYRQKPLLLATWNRDTHWTKHNVQPAYSCCPNVLAMRHPLCDEPECFEHDVMGIHVPHHGSKMCQSGGRPHCTCDLCF